jgi:hypothetical protein
MNYETDPSMAGPMGKRPVWQAYRLVQPLRGLLRPPEMEDVLEAPSSQRSWRDSHRESESSQDSEIKGYLTLSPPTRSRL